MGYVWSYIFVLVVLIRPGSLQPAILLDSLGLRFLCSSFITLTSVGYGYTVPESPLA
jgi:hypothetical protein